MMDLDSLENEKLKEASQQYQRGEESERSCEENATDKTRDCTRQGACGGLRRGARWMPIGLKYHMRNTASERHIMKTARDVSFSVGMPASQILILALTICIILDMLIYLLKL